MGSKFTAPYSFSHPPGPTYRHRWGLFPNPGVAQEIAGLDAEADVQRIAYLLASHEFPFDFTRALELALFHTFGARRVATLLHATGEFEERGQRRYDDTGILIGRFMEAGWDNERGADALARMNDIHARFKIPNDDFLFVLWTFIDFPIDWANRYGWRRMTEHEARAWFEYWRRIGQHMGLSDIPDSKAAFDAFTESYEREHMVATPAARQVFDATLEVAKSWLPRPLRGAVLPVVRALARPRLLAAAGYTPAPAWLKTIIDRTLRLRAAIKRVLPLEAYDRSIENEPYRSYPEGLPPSHAVGPRAKP